jgi:hypothetical protein
MGADFPKIPHENVLFSRVCKLISLRVVPCQVTTKASASQVPWCVLCWERPGDAVLSRWGSESTAAQAASVSIVQLPLWIGPCRLCCQGEYTMPLLCAAEKLEAVRQHPLRRRMIGIRHDSTPFEATEYRVLYPIVGEKYYYGIVWGFSTPLFVYIFIARMPCWRTSRISF